MSISKCFNGYQVEKSKSFSIKTSVKNGQTNGYLFEDDLENSRIILKWYNDDWSISEKLTKIKELYKILDRHGFADYMKLDEEEAEIHLTKFV